MLRDIIREARDVPERVREHGSRLAGVVGRAPEALSTRREEARRWLRRRLYEARESSERSLWTLHLNAVETANGLLERTGAVPGIGRVSQGARELLETVERATVAPPLEDYEALNVREIMRALKELDHFGLLRVAHHEATHKNRKTILDAIEREQGRRARLAAVA